MNPKVSIIMGIYNCESTLKESIDSIVNQTFQDWEFIMCDDGSTDKTYEIAKEYEVKYPDKFLVIKNSENMGLAYSLNHCLKYAKGKYIARQDGDDYSKPNRLERQVDFLDDNPKLGLVSTGIKLFDNENIWDGYMPKSRPESIDVINCKAFVHAAAMIRKELLDKVNGYRVSNETLRNEDFDLWCRIYKVGIKGGNILERLYCVREDISAYKRKKFKYRIDEMRIRKKYFFDLNIDKKKIPIIIKPIIVGIIPGNLILKIKKYIY